MNRNGKNKLAKILLVEDDPNLREVLCDFLELEGYDIVTAINGEDGLTVFYRHSFDLCLVDVMMPKKDGFTMVEEIRRINKEVPVIFITAKAMKEDRIKGFHTGCDDYICKPFSTEELSLRISAVLKRCQTKSIASGLPKDEIFEIGKFIFDYANMNLRNGDLVQNLTRKEADLLRLLVINRNQLLKRETALKIVWGDDDYFIGRSMDVFITKLRKYFKDDPSVSISNVHGTGFKFEVIEQ
jgi:DNA-binding response OmpR family regulator